MDSQSGARKTGKPDRSKRFQCPFCAYRTNWKPDVKKHMSVAHPQHRDADTVTLSPRTAKATLSDYMKKERAITENGRREGYFRPFTCSVCGHRSNWAPDLKRHIRRNHGGEGEVEELTMAEASATLEEYLLRRARNRGVGHNTRCLADTRNEEAVEPERTGWFDISTTTTAVAVVHSAVHADGTAITTGIAERGGNIKASPAESKTAALVGGNTKLMQKH
ncbi:hypothetical protein TSMEX_011214 [Taenia solium]